MLRVLAIVTAAGLCLGCDYNLTLTSPTSATPNISNTNTNTNTNNNDRSDVTPGPPSSTPDPRTTPTSAPLPLPASAEPVVRSLAVANPSLLAQSCQQDTIGAPAWAFLDLVVRTLALRDPRFGYLCKDDACLAVGRDVITYKATNTDLGLWVVDVINDCGFTNTIQWVVLPFDVTRRWTAVRP